MDETQDPLIAEAVTSSPILTELVEAIGLHLTEALCHRWGGRRLYIPAEFRMGDHPIIDCVGRDAARKLAWFYGGQQFNVPKGQALLDARVHRQVLDAKAEGLTVPELSRRFDRTERTIRQILQRSRAAGHAPSREVAREPSRPRQPSTKYRAPRHTSPTRPPSAQLSLF